MRSRFLQSALLFLLAAPAPALDGQPGMHDLSTVVRHNGRYYSYGTGNGLPLSVSERPARDAAQSR